MSTTPRPRSPLPDSPSLSLPTVEAPDSPDQPGPPPKLNSPSDSSSDSESDTPGPPKLNPVAESSSKSDFDSPTFAYEDESDDDRYLWRGEALFEYLLVRIDKDFHISLTPFASDQKETVNLTAATDNILAADPSNDPIVVRSFVVIYRQGDDISVLAEDMARKWLDIHQSRLVAARSRKTHHPDGKDTNIGTISHGGAHASTLSEYSGLRKRPRSPSPLSEYSGIRKRPRSSSPLSEDSGSRKRPRSGPSPLSEYSGIRKRPRSRSPMGYANYCPD